MTPPFSVYVTARFERDYRRLLKAHADLGKVYETVLSVLNTDPYNRSRSHNIKKLEQVASGEGNTASVAVAFVSDTISMARRPT